MTDTPTLETHYADGPYPYKPNIDRFIRDYGEGYFQSVFDLYGSLELSSMALNSIRKMHPVPRNVSILVIPEDNRFDGLNASKTIPVLEIHYATIYPAHYETFRIQSERQVIQAIYLAVETGDKLFVSRTFSVTEGLIHVKTFSGEQLVDKVIYGGIYGPALQWVKSFIGLYNHLQDIGLIKQQVYAKRFNHHTFVCPYCLQEGIRPDRMTDEALVFKCECGEEHHHKIRVRDRQ